MNRLVGSKGYVVNFRQVFGNLETSESGLVTVGVTGVEGSRWKVAYISSSLTRVTGLWRAPPSSRPPAGGLRRRGTRG